MDIEINRQRQHQECLKWVPVAISFYSAMFATFILYPWHIEISRELVKMQEFCSL